MYFQYPREFVAFAPFPTAWAPPATMVVHHPVMQTPLPTRDEQSLPHAAAPPSKKIKQDYHTGRKRRFSDASSQTMMEMPVVKNEGTSRIRPQWSSFIDSLARHGPRCQQARECPKQGCLIPWQGSILGGLFRDASSTRAGIAGTDLERRGLLFRRTRIFCIILPESTIYDSVQ